MGCGNSLLVKKTITNDTPLDVAEKDAIVIETKERRSNQHLLENIVHEEFDRDIHEFYVWNESTILGTGISGSVKVCTHIKTNIKYALKTLAKKKIKIEKLAQLKQEIRIMALLDHPNILRLHEYFETLDNIYLVLDLCTGGELLDRLHRQSEHHYSEQVACKLVHTMLGAVRYCHEHNIVHRDLKLENFLFENESPNAELKLIDFGLSQHFEHDEVLHSPVGTPYYVAPEVLSGSYDSRCDIWSVGVIAYMLLSGSPPFYGPTDNDTLRAVKSGQFVFIKKRFDIISDLAKDFITKCLTKSVAHRPTAEEAQKHPWFEIIHHCTAPVSLKVIDRLRGFDKKSALSRLCMEVVAYTLTTEQIGGLRNEFSKFDTSDSGEVTYDQLKQALQSQGSFSDEDINTIFTNIDVEHTGKIHYHEFIAATISRNEIKEENIKVAFEKLSHHHEFITAEDIKDMLGKDSTIEEVEKMLSDLNLDIGSKIFYPEFKMIMRAEEASSLRGLGKSGRRTSASGRATTSTKKSMFSTAMIFGHGSAKIDPTGVVDAPSPPQLPSAAADTRTSKNGNSLRLKSDIAISGISLSNTNTTIGNQSRLNSTVQAESVVTTAAVATSAGAGSTK